MLKLTRVYILTLITLFVLSSNIMALPIQAIFFDMDGVLVDTEFLKYEAWKKSLKDRLEIDFTLDEYIPLAGYSSEEILSRILSTHSKSSTDADFESLVVLKNRLYKDKQKLGVEPIDPAVSFLKEILALKKSTNVKVGIVSSAGHNEIRTNLKHIGINPGDLDAIASGEDDLKDIEDPAGTNKPKPYIYQSIAKLLKVNPNKCVVFEDTNAGVTAANSAGMRVYAVPNKFTLKHDFSKSIKVVTFDKVSKESAKNLLKNGVVITAA